MSSPKRFDVGVITPETQPKPDLEQQIVTERLSDTLISLGRTEIQRTFGAEPLPLEVMTCRSLRLSGGIIVLISLLTAIRKVIAF